MTGDIIPGAHPVNRRGQNASQAGITHPQTRCGIEMTIIHNDTIPMTDNEKIKEILSRLPDEPGVYQMFDADATIIYIGKANSLKKRVTSYFTKRDHDPKTSVLVKNISDIEYIITDTGIEALLLESTLIKKHKPKFNVRLKDDKRYPYIAVTMNEEYPRVIYTRSINRATDRYFGPFTDARAAKNTSVMINTLFRLKTCRRQIPLKENERPCINYQIGKCSGVCTGKISREEYMALVNDAVSFLEGNIEPVIEDLNRRMKQYSDSMEFEKAAQMRDMIFDIQTVSQKQKVDLPSGINQDCMGIRITGGEAVLVLFEFRHGVLTGRRVNIFDNAEYTEPGSILATFMVDYYRGREIPSRILTSDRVPESALISGHLSSLAGTKVTITEARSKDDSGIMNMLSRNIDIIAAERKLSEQNNPSAGLTLLREALDMESEPDIMECFDISNFQGTDSVASMVQFRSGRPERSGYRRYKIRGYQESNDPGMIHEAVSRRLQHLVNEELELPDLVIIDGGPTQLTRAIEAAANFAPGLKIISLAKKFEEVYTDPDMPPLRLPESSPALRLLQNIRDEAHRFAITYHRKLRDRRTVSSELDNIPDTGEKTKMLLLKHFRSVEGVKSATIEEIAAVPGIGRSRAAKIYGYFHQEQKEE